MDFGHSKACEGLALWAGREVGLKVLTPVLVAEDEAARTVRDGAWAEYRKRLADRTTYTLAQIRAWLAERGVRVSIASVARDRAPVLAREDRLNLGSEVTRRFMAATAGADTGEVLQAALKRVGQILFETSLKFEAEDLRDALEAGDFVRLAEAVAKLSKAHAETGILRERLAAMRAAFDKELKNRTEKGDGRLTQKDVDEIRRAVFGGAA
jgi:hypothetical protein